ncbi:hypothetical protein SteCoe_37316 [Stentor coeruleus]|uniref:RING-type domain-containing protein n=1 Tax=Stentor coeruleus TaxID=5963 RepID=A0A1R2ANH6_9CILI|nr:hypothetical protein SteCoe_37316 [Stentor coeruleus]
MNLSCVYCLNPFSSTCIPYTIGCQHFFCSDCIGNIKLLGCPPSCPIDKIRFEEESQSRYTEFHEYFRTLCLTHYKQCKLECEDHDTFLCEICRISHKECKVVSRSASEIVNNIDEMILNSRKKAHKIIDLASERGIDNIEDGLAWAYDEKTEVYSLLDNKERTLNLETMRKYLRDLDQETKILLKIIENNAEVKVEAQINQLEKSLKNPQIPVNPIYSIMQSINFFSEVLSKAFPNLDYSNQNEIDFLVEEAILRTDEEIDFIWNGLTMMRYFERTWIIPTTNNIYSGYFENLASYDWLLNGFSFGTPASLSGFVYIHEFTVTIENTCQNYENYVVEYTHNRKTHHFKLNNPAIWKSKTKIWIYIRIEGQNHYMFEHPVIDDYVRATNVDGDLYYELFPILLINFQKL